MTESDSERISQQDQFRAGDDESYPNDADDTGGAATSGLGTMEDERAGAVSSGAAPPAPYRLASDDDDGSGAQSPSGT
jgi:hypothetical protein